MAEEDVRQTELARRARDAANMELQALFLVGVMIR